MFSECAIMNITQEGKEDVGREEGRRMGNGEFLQPVLSQYLETVGVWMECNRLHLEALGI